MGAIAARQPRNVTVEQQNSAAVGRKLAGDEVEQRRLAGPVGTDNQPALARLNREIDVLRDVQPAERLVQPPDGQRGHDFCPSIVGCAGKLRRFASRHAARVRRTVPGTSPSGMNTTIATKIAPSMKFQRETYALTTSLMMTTRLAPTIGPSNVPAPPEITISKTSADEVSARAGGLMNW